MQTADSETPDAPITLRLPGHINIGYAVLFDTQGQDLPDRDAMLSMAGLWLDIYSRVPLTEALKVYIASELAVMEVRPIDDVPLPDIEILHEMGLGHDEEDRLRSASHGVMLYVGDVLKAPRFGLHAARALAFGIAQALDGVVYDPGEMRVLPLPLLRRPIPVDGIPLIFEHVLTASSIDFNGLAYMTVEGLDKLRLPPLVLEDIPRELAPRIAQFACGVAHRLAMKALAEAYKKTDAPAQLVLEPEMRIGQDDVARATGADATETPEGVRGWTTIRLRHIKGPQLSMSDSHLEILPPAGFHGDRSVWYYSVLEDLIGSQKDIRLIKADSETLEIAHLRAMDELPVMKQRYLAGLEPDEMFAVKKGFPTSSGDKEYLWIGVLGWTDDGIEGVVANEPNSVADLRAGQKVLIPEADVYDWQLVKRNGARLGNYTGEVLRREGLL